MMWIIDGEWSEYHNMVANQDGWGLTQRQGVWEIVTHNSQLFPTDNDARLHVLAHEHDEETSLFRTALSAVFIGSIRG